MGGRLGTGPVFAFEWMQSARRWQIYAARSGIVAILLAGLTIVWLEELAGQGEATFQRLAEVGQDFSMTVVLTQFALVLLVAPAMTAGAICQDKTNGTLAHLLVTDLSSAEIVLGKLAARLVPVLGLIASSLPIVAISTLLGGTDPVGLAGAYLVTIGAAVLACALAMVLSVWGTKVHEVLVATYLALIGWVILLWVYAIVFELWLGVSNFERFWMTHALVLTNPLMMILFPMGIDGPGNPFNYISLAEQVAFLAGCLSLSVILAGVATARVRAVAARAGGPVANPWWWRAGTRVMTFPGRTWPISALSRRRWRWRINPTLDGNPVLWREWHRNRPSRWGRTLWLLFVVGAVGFSLLSVWAVWFHHGDEEFACLVNALSVSVGLLMVLAPAVTSLAEERARGSLDVLLTTTLTTREVVWGKWLAAYRACTAAGAAGRGGGLAGRRGRRRPVPDRAAAGRWPGPGRGGRRGEPGPVPGVAGAEARPGGRLGRRDLPGRHDRLADPDGGDPRRRHLRRGCRDGEPLHGAPDFQHDHRWRGTAPRLGADDLLVVLLDRRDRERRGGPARPDDGDVRPPPRPGARSVGPWVAGAGVRERGRPVPDRVVSGPHQQCR